MSTIIIGGGGKAAIDLLIVNQHRMTADQKAAAKALMEKFIDDVKALIAQIEDTDMPAK